MIGTDNIFETMFSLSIIKVCLYTMLYIKMSIFVGLEAYWIEIF